MKNLILYLAPASGGCVEKLPGEVTGTQSIRVESRRPRIPVARARTSGSTDSRAHGDDEPHGDRTRRRARHVADDRSPGLRPVPRHADAVARRRAARDGPHDRRRGDGPDGDAAADVRPDDDLGRRRRRARARPTRPARRRRCGSATRSSPISRRRPTRRRYEALFRSPLEDKQVTVNASQATARTAGSIVTSVFAQGYTVSDVHVRRERHAAVHRRRATTTSMVFSFSRAARSGLGAVLEVGQVIDGFAGGRLRVQRPHRDRLPADVRRPDDAATSNPARLPAPRAVRPDVVRCRSAIRCGRINFEKQRGRRRSRSINGDGVPARRGLRRRTSSGSSIRRVAGDCGTCDDRHQRDHDRRDLRARPATLVGKTGCTRVVGVLRPVSIGSFNVWIIYPRSAADVTLP